MPTRRVIAVAALAALSAAARAEDTTYPITMFRPLAPGQTHRVEGECMMVQTTRGVLLGDAVAPSTTKVLMRLKSDMEVDEVDEKGRATSVTHTIRECVVTQDGMHVHDIKPGANLTVTRNGYMSDMSLDGVPVSEQMLTMFRLLVSVEGDGATEDEMFGTSTPRQVGDTWPINVERTLVEFQRQTAQPLRAEQISGQSRLVDVFEHDGQPCLKVFTEFATEDAIPGLDALPPGAHLEAASMKVKWEGLLPVDERQPCLARSAQLDLHVIMVQEGMGTLESDTRLLSNLKLTPTATSDVATVGEESSAAPD